MHISPATAVRHIGFYLVIFDADVSGVIFEIIVYITDFIPVPVTLKWQCGANCNISTTVRFFDQNFRI